MKVCLVVLGLVALSAAAPQNWPYRDSLMPYRYGYPTQTQYKYLPQIEDDEDVGPYLGVGRQDVVVGSDGQSSLPQSLLQQSHYYVQRRPPPFKNKAWLASWKIGDGDVKHFHPTFSFLCRDFGRLRSRKWFYVAFSFVLCFE
jgi:hypothetical protein